MNAFRQAVANMASKMPKPPAGSAPSGGAIGKLAVLVGSLGLGGYGLLNSMYQVNAGHQAIIYNRLGGIDENTIKTEGLNFVVPWFQRPIVFDVRTRPKLINSTSGSKDLQMVEISLRVLLKPDPTKLPFIYRRLGQDFEERVLPSIVNEVTKAIVAKFNASELLTKRDMVSREIREMLVKRAMDFHILLDDVAITHLAFSKEYTAAIEAKQVAKQDAERSKYIVDKAIQEKQQIVIKAQGEAQSAELIGAAIKKNPAFIQLRKIEASKEIANTMAGGTAKIYLDSNTLLLNGLADAAENDVNTERPELSAAPTAAKGWF